MGDLLRGLYNDLYTAGNAHLDLLKQVREQEKASGSVRKTTESALKSANDALEEARKLFGEMPVSEGMDVKAPSGPAPVQTDTGGTAPAPAEPEKQAETPPPAPAASEAAPAQCDEKKPEDPLLAEIRARLDEFARRIEANRRAIRGEKDDKDGEG